VVVRSSAVTCLTLQPASPLSAAPRRGFAQVDEPAPSRARDEDFDAALTRLYREQYPRLFQYLDRLSGDPHLAADLVQEAFVRLFDRGALPRQPGAWLVTVATNLLRDDSRRSRRRQRLVETSPEAVPAPSAAPDPARSVETAEERARVRRALDRLHPRDRKALLLRHAGYSYREIAAALALAETGIGAVLLRAMKSFRKTYSESADDAD
jgi:RNA polymerase sigma factor (sigma-70 family)